MEIELREVAPEVLDELRTHVVKEAGATELVTSVGQGEGTPYGFYLGLGFVPTGEYAAWGEEILVLSL